MNLNIFYFLYSLSESKIVENIAYVFSFLVFYGALILLPIWVFFRYRKDFRNFYILISSGFLAWVMSAILKLIFKMPRPYLVLDIYPSYPDAGFSFPSGHASVSFAIAFALYFINKKLGSVAILVAFLIGLSRVILGVHFPVDILGGFILGALTAYFVRFLYNKLAKKV